MMIEIRDLTPGETDTAAAVLGRGMRDNPLHVQAFGADADARERALTHIFKGVLRQYVSKGAVLGTFSSEEIVGVCAMVEPGRCQPSGGERLRLLPEAIAGAGLGGTVRLLKWAAAWARHDPKEPHWHLGPVGVERNFQGQGVGTTMLRVFCQRMDALQAMAYLETDKRENVAFYERFGFQVKAQEPVLETPNWFMVRPPAGGA
ncbi:MAG: GNAT family N-acetyltransferase [Thermoanaerobaculia bacterium]